MLVKSEGGGAIDVTDFSPSTTKLRPAGRSGEGSCAMALFSRTTRDEMTDTALGVDEQKPLPARPRGVGQVLREARQSFGRDIPQVGTALRIRSEYLEAIETGQYKRLPGPTYAIGFIRTYAEYLGLDGAEIVRRFKQETEGLDLKRDLSFPMPLTERSIPGGTILLVALILGLCGYGIWYYLSSVKGGHVERVGSVPGSLLPPADTNAAPAGATRGPQAPTEAAAAAPPATGPVAAPPATPVIPPSPARSIVASAPQVTTPAPVSSLPPPPSLPAPIAPTPTPVASSPLPPVPQPRVETSTSASPAPTEVAGLPPVPAASAPTDPSHVFGVTNGPARIVIRATGTSWIEIRDAQEKQLFNRVMQAGEIYRVPEKPGLLLGTGNAGGLEVSVDGRSAPALGAFGVIRHHILLDPQKLLAGTAVQE